MRLFKRVIGCAIQYGSLLPAHVHCLAARLNGLLFGVYESQKDAHDAAFIDIH